MGIQLNKKILIGVPLHLSPLYQWLAPNGYRVIQVVIGFLLAIAYVSAVIGCVVDAARNEKLKAAGTSVVWAVMVFILGGLGAAHVYFWMHIWVSQSRVDSTQAKV